jgi:hypothetical protein
MPVERRGSANLVMIDLVHQQREEPADFGRGRQPSMDGTSRVKGDCQARFWAHRSVTTALGVARGEIPWAGSAGRILSRLICGRIAGAGTSIQGRPV